MPEVFRQWGYSFYFYSREHEPIHIHVEGDDGVVILDLLDGEFVVREQHGIKVGDMKRILRAVAEHKESIIRAWQKHFGKNLT